MGQVTRDSNIDAYIPISVSTLIPASFVGMSLYLPDDASEKQLYRGPDVPLQQADLERLMARKATTLFLRDDEHATYQQCLREKLNSILNDESVSPGIRFSSLNAVVRDVQATAFQEEDTEQTVQVCLDLSGIPSR